ncbi:MAG: alpha-mannosidase, partial [Actinobacteria bacterium]|nr:alpha-mannosidase [Actinomycetota bacterium]
PDANMPAGESLVRQLLYGQRYFRARFGSIHKTCWLPDCFGFTPGLPQVLLGAGIENFFTHKLNWSETNEFPYDLFWWEGLDGSRVLAHGFHNPEGGYNGDVDPATVTGTWRNFRGKAHHAESLLTVGFGDGAGGPTPEMLERARALQYFPALPELRFTRVQDFYDDVRSTADGALLPAWVGELYFELHRGTLTSQGRIKYLHRRAERDLVAAEVLGSLGALVGNESPESLEDPWRILLRNEFHDILPGSSVREVNDAAESELGNVVEQAGEAIHERLVALACASVPPGDERGLLVANPDLSARPVRIESSHELEGSQAVDGGYVLTSEETILGLEARVLFGGSARSGLDASPDRLENDFVAVHIGEDGAISSVWDKVAGRETLAGRGNQIWAYVDKPRAWDAWDVDAGYADDGKELVAGAVELVEDGPHRAAIRIDRRFRDSVVTQEVRLWCNSARIDFATSIDWRDRHWLLKSRWPLAVRAARAAFETAFGVVERPTHRNTSWDAAQFEVAGHRFADLSEPGYGVALLNDGRYGYHALGNELGLSLLRAPAYPDPLADEGSHSFTYALFPHAGSWLEGGVLAEAEDLNRRLPSVPCNAAGPVSLRPLKLEGVRLGLGALKPQEDGDGLILRVYEPAGARGALDIDLPRGWILGPELNLLETETGEPNLHFTPFKIRTYLLQRS